MLGLKHKIYDTPLHYHVAEGTFVFASEIKALLASGFCQARANMQAVYDWQTYGIANHSNETFFRDIHALPPGHYIQLNEGVLSTGLKPIPFWKLTNNASIISYDQAKAQFREIFASAIAFHLRSDVSVGSCLSGGLDSSSIVSEMRRQKQGGDLHTFTSGFSEKEFDERHWAEIAVKSNCSTPHYALPTQQGFLDGLDNLIWHQDEPIAREGLNKRSSDIAWTV